MVNYRQDAPVLTAQTPAPILGGQAPAPYVYPSQFDFSSIINMIVPLMGMMLMFSMMTPMMKSMGDSMK